MLLAIGIKIKVAKILSDHIELKSDGKYKILTQLQAQTNIGRIEKEREGEGEGENGKIKLAWSGLSVTLMPGDSIVVKAKVGAVFDTGEVYNCGFEEIQRNKSRRDY